MGDYSGWLSIQLWYTSIHFHTLWYTFVIHFETLCFWHTLIHFDTLFWYTLIHFWIHFDLPRYTFYTFVYNFYTFVYMFYTFVYMFYTFVYKFLTAVDSSSPEHHPCTSFMISTLTVLEICAFLSFWRRHRCHALPRPHELDFLIFRSYIPIPTPVPNFRVNRPFFV